VFAANSRYYGLPVLTMTQPDGTQALYVARRLLPDPSTLSQIAGYTVRPGDRLDLIAYAQFGDPQLGWRIADAARVLDPDELTKTPGTVLAITLPPGITAAAGG
jgi:hypothetical protein